MEIDWRRWGPGMLGGAALAFGVAASGVGILATAIWVPITVPCHELGHAAAHWLSGAPALPALFLTFVLAERSVKFALGISAVLFALLWVCLRFRRQALSCFVALVIFVQIILSYFVSAETQEQVAIVAGFAGEAAWAPVFIFFAFENLGRWWFRHRILFAVAAIISLGNSLGTWAQILIGARPLPYGAFLEQAEHGDINRLVDGFAWSPSHVATLFFSIAVAALIMSVFFSIARLRSRPNQARGYDSTKPILRS